MSIFFLYIYNFFSKHKIIFISFIILLFSFIIFFASKIELEEDLTKFIPKDKKLEKLNILKNSKILEKLVINISLSDTTANSNPDKLIQFANEFSSIIKSSSSNKYIKDITLKVSQDTMLEVYNSFYNNIPIFLNDDDYKKIDTLISDSAIKKSVSNIYNNLISPTGLITKNSLLRDPLGITFIALKKLNNLMIDNNFTSYDGYIITKNKKNLLVIITPLYPSAETSKNAELIDEIDNTINILTVKSNNTINAEYYGAAAAAVCNAHQIKKDSLITTSIALLVILILVSFFFKSKRTIFFISLPIIFGAGFSLAILYLIKTKISAISLGAGSIILGISIDYSLHVLNHYRITRNPKDIIKDLATPLLIGSTTTIGAFFALLFTKSETLHDFGMFAGFSLLGAVLFCLIISPHIIHLTKKKNVETTTIPIIDKLSSFRFGSNRLIFFIILILTVVFYFTSQNVSFEGDMMNMNYSSEKLKHAEENLNKISNLSLKSVYVLSEGKNLDEALNVNDKNVEKLDSLKAHNIIKDYTSPGNFLLSEKKQNERIKKWNNYWSEEKKEKVKNLLITYSEPYKFKSSAFNQFYTLLDKNYEPINISEFNNIKNLFLSDYIIEDSTGINVISIIKVQQENRKDVFSFYKDNKNVSVLDKQYFTILFIDIIQSDFNLILWLSSLLVLGFLIFSFGRLELGILSFLPMLISWIWILGIMGLFGFKFNIVNIIVSTFIFGLCDDYAIFMMDGLLQKHKYGKGHLDSYKTSIVFSALVTIIGIGVLIFAKHPALKSIAAITIIGMLIAVFMTFTIIPRIFKWMTYVNGKKRLVPATLFKMIYSLIFYSYFWIAGFLVFISANTILLILPVSKKKRKYIYHLMIMYATRSTMYVMFLVKKKIINFKSSNFKKPVLIICNHQSHIDIPLSLMFIPKLIVLTQDWVWNSKAIGKLVKKADFYPVSQGLENLMEKLQEKVDDGYSIFIFPEGSRSESMKIQRFHKGAFYLAEKLNLDIIPMVMHGTGDYIKKGELLPKRSKITVKFLDRISINDTSFGTNYTERTKIIGRYFKNEYEKLKKEHYDPAYYKYKLINNYLYRGPVLEWYLKIKLKFEKNYKVFNDLVPENCEIIDIGCGYGFLTYMLSFLSPKRKITGIDYDQEKINVANNCSEKTNLINFICDDITEYPINEADVYILSDVIHYLLKDKQEELLVRCMNNLKNDGIIIIRDANKSLKKKQAGTYFTEFFSTNIGFNKTTNKLEFMSADDIISIASKNNYNVHIYDNSILTSNIFYIIKKNKSNQLGNG